MYWLFAVAMQVILETIISIRYRNTAKHHPKNALLNTFIVYGLGVAPVGLAYAWFFREDLVEVSATTFFWIVTASVLFAVANVLVYKTYAKIEASLYVIINSSKYILIMGVAYLLLGDALTLQQIVGVILILIASLGISWASKGAKSKPVAAKHILIAFAASTAIGLAQVSERVAVVASNMVTYILLGWTLQILLLMVIARPKVKQIRSIRRQGLLSELILIGILRGSAGVFLVYAISVTQNIALVSAIAATRVVSVAVASYFILRERTMPVARFGAAIATVLGIVLIVT